MTMEKSALVQAKKLLRQKVRADLLTVSQNQLLEQSLRVLQILRGIPIYQNANKIAIYMNMPTSEVKTIPIIEQLFKDGKRVFLPKITKLSQTHQLKRFSKQHSQLQMLEIPNFDAIHELTPVGPFKLLEPMTGTDALSSEVKGLDMILLPGLAFTSNCYRMGHGGGFYDDYIKRHIESGFGKPLLVGIGLKEQLVDNIPLEDHDECLDAVIIDDTHYLSASSLTTIS